MVGVCFKYKQINYGSKLQALATVKMLEELGLEYSIIHYKKDIVFYIKSLVRFCNIVFLNDRYDQIQRKLEFRRHPEVQMKINLRNKILCSFDKQFFDHHSEEYESYGHLKKCCSQKYECVLTCSDQLWSPAALGSGFYNLMFAPMDMMKVSWASSFGVSKIPWYQEKRTKRYLERIQYISMRENRGAEIVEELTGRQVPVLMDPVFVFDKEEWEKMIPPSVPEWEPYIFCYFLGSNEQHRAAAKDLAEKTGKKIVTLRHLDRYVGKDEQFGDYAPYDVSPQRFINILRNADYICTDSFHGAAFSILNEKQFLVFNRYADSSSNSKNSRIDSLCKNFNLENRRYKGDQNIQEAMVQKISYKEVRERMQVYRCKTKRYLAEALLNKEYPDMAR